MIDKKDIRKAGENASSYTQFKNNLRKLVGKDKVPHTYRPPSSMKNWGRRLRYDLKQSGMKGSHFTQHDLRLVRYYTRLVEMEVPNPEWHISRHPADL